MQGEPGKDRGEMTATSPRETLALAGAFFLGVLLIAAGVALKAPSSKPGPCTGRVCPPSYRAFTMRVDSSSGDACVCILEAQPVASSSK